MCKGKGLRGVNGGFRAKGHLIVTQHTWEAEKRRSSDLVVWQACAFLTLSESKPITYMFSPSFLLYISCRHLHVSLFLLTSAFFLTPSIVDVKVLQAEEVNSDQYTLFSVHGNKDVTIQATLNLVFDWRGVPGVNYVIYDYYYLKWDIRDLEMCLLWQNVFSKVSLPYVTFFVTFGYLQHSLHESNCDRSLWSGKGLFS